jgi:ureidoacrylate peracid hydrolase
MPDVTYENDITGLLVIDPYNDFISEGGKIWPHGQTQSGCSA